MLKKSFQLLLTFFVLGWHVAFPNNKVISDTTKRFQLGFVLPEGAHKLTVPFELNNNLIVIGVLLNNALPLKFILDTGVRTTVLTEKTFTDLLNLTYSRKITIPGVGGEKLITAYVTNNVTLQIQGMIGHGHALIVLEHDLLQLKNYLGTDVHGILGYELFSRFVVEINYDSKVVTFYDPDFYKKRKRYEELELTIEDTKPYILANFSLKDSSVHTGKFLLDTGASHSFLIDKYSDTTYYVPQPSLYSHLGRGLAGDMYGEISRVDKLSIGSYFFNDVIATFPDTTTYSIGVGMTPRNGTIGGGLMSRYKITFDFVHEKLYLKKGRSYTKPFEYNLSGVVIKATGLQLRNYEITEIRNDCSAKLAGVQVGDKIISINRQLTKSLTLDEVLGLLNTKANKSIRLLVLRNGVKEKYQFKLERKV